MFGQTEIYLIFMKAKAMVPALKTCNMLSSKWNMTDNVYVQSRMGVIATPAVSVDHFIVEYASTHNRKDTLLYNNRIFFGYINPSEARKIEYDVNRKWILDHFNTRS